MKDPTRFTIEFGQEEDGRWICELLEIPGCMKYGASKAEAFQAMLTLLHQLAILADTTEEHGDLLRRLAKT